MKEGLIKDTYELIIKELQTLLTILYLLMIGIGMLFNYKKYSRFGINIFEYADVFDFLIAPFQDRRILLVSALSLVIPLLLLWWDGMLKRRYPKLYSKVNFGWDKKSWYQTLRLLVFGYLFFFFIFEASNGYANFMKNNIDNQAIVAIRYTDSEVIEGNLIGKTKEVLFLWSAEKVKVIPLTSSVKEMEVK